MRLSRFNRAQLKVVVFLFITITLITGLFFVVMPFLTHAESSYMTAIVVDDDGEVNFSPNTSGAVANFSYEKSGEWGFDSKNYSVKISLQNLPVGEGLEKLVRITLPVGMVWVDDASSDGNLLQSLDSSIDDDGIEDVALEVEPVLNYTFSGSGSRIYHITSGTSALAINVIVKADKAICMDYINDAIKATLEIDGEVESEASVDVNVPSGKSTGGSFYRTSYTLYMPRDVNYQTNESYYRRIELGYVNGRYKTPRIIKSVSMDITVNDPVKAEIRLSVSSTRYTFTNNGGGSYTLTYRPSGVDVAATNIPYYIRLSNSMNAGENVKITFSNAKVSYWHPSGTDTVVNFGDVTGNATSTITAVALGSEPDVAVGFSSLNPNGRKKNDMEEYAALSGLSEEIGILGYNYIVNRGTTASNPQTVRLKFDTDALGVMAFNLPCEPNGTITEIRLKRKSGATKNAALSKSCSGYGSGNFVSYSDLGLSRSEVISDPISELEYELGVIPGAKMLTPDDTNRTSFAFFGKRFNTNDAIATIELFDTGNATNTTGEAKMVIKYDSTQRKGGIDIDSGSTREVNAGETLHFSTQILSWGRSELKTSYLQSVPFPIIYIRSEAVDANGNFLPITNIKVLNGESRGNQDITDKFGVPNCYNTAEAYVCMLDGRNVTDGSAAITYGYVGDDGAVTATSLTVKYSINTSLTTPDQMHNLSEAVFVQDDKLSPTNLNTHGARGDTHRVTDGNGTTVYGTSLNYYKIRGWASIGVENSGKHVDSGTWMTWDDGSNPIMIGSEEGSLADMKTTMINSSGVVVSGPTIAYLPIPKKDQDWGALSYEEKPFEFSAMIYEAIDNPDGRYFTIEYGKNITPSDNGVDLDDQSSRFYSDTSGWNASDWREVNCIKVIATNMPADAVEYEFIYKLRVIDASSAVDNATNTWRPLYHQELTNSIGDRFAGWYKGSYVSVMLTDGKILGEIFVDADENGKKNAGESSLKEAGWNIDLYDKNTNVLIRSTATDSDGKYAFADLAMNENGYYVIVTNKHPINGAGTTYLFTQKGSESNSGRYNTDNQAEGKTSSNPIHATATIRPISPSRVTGEATYNIGVVEYAEEIEYFGDVIFNDYDNQYDTRPDSVTINVIGSDGSEYEIDIDTTADSTWRKSLPKYSNIGERLTYVFSTPDIDDYSVAGSWSGANKYDFIFTLTKSIVAPGDDPSAPKTNDRLYIYVSMIFVTIICGAVVLFRRRR